MGTVPDPLRSAKCPLVTASEEENGLRELQPSKHQCKQATIERNSNGFPFIAKLQPAGDHLFEADVPKSEQHCEYEISQPNMPSPETFSPSKKDCLTTLESKKNPEQEGKAESLGAPEEHVYATVKEPAAQETNKIVQSSTGEQFCDAGDKKGSCPGGDGSAVKSKAQNSGSFLSPSNIHQAAPAAADEAASGKELELLPALEMKARANIDVELKGTTDASSHPGARSVQETESKCDHAGASQPLYSPKPVEEVGPEVTKFKDTGTMTAQPEGRFGDEEAAIRTHQDAEVQAVASVESKSASTSPSIFAAFLSKNVPSQAIQKQEQLHIIYTGAGGQEQSEIVDDVSVLVQAAPSTGIMPAVQIQSPAAIDREVVAQAIKHKDSPAGTHDTAHSALSSPSVSGITQQTLVEKIEAQTAHAARNQSTVSQQLSDNSLLLKTKPIYQINVSPGNQPVALSHSVNSETKLPPCSALPGSVSKPQHPEPSAEENQQTSPSCCRTSEPAKVSTTPKDDDHEGQLHVKTISDTDPASFHADVKPKREGVSPKELGVSNRGVAFLPQTTSAPVVNQREQKAVPEDNKGAGGFGSQNLPARSELSQNSASSVGTKSSDARKGSKAHAPITAAQPVPEGRKKEPESATETKVQLKQSKHVRDVVWDEQGMTWEVYGASLDPESLGIAIQNHLQRQIREHEKLIKSQDPQTRKSISSDTSSNKKLKGRQHSVFQSMLQNFRRPNCCVRPAASSVLD